MKKDVSLQQQLDIKKLRIASVKQNQNEVKKGGLTKQEIEVLRYLFFYSIQLSLSLHK